MAPTERGPQVEGSHVTDGDTTAAFAGLANPAGRSAEGARQAHSGLLTAAQLAPLTRLDDTRSFAALVLNLAIAAAAIALGLVLWPNPWVLLAVGAVGVQQHGLFVLAHEAVHYRLASHRGWNDAIGRVIGMAGGISMCTYRVIHRLHHRHLFGPQDPDTTIHAGYPRGRAYLARKLALDLIGWNAWKTFAYFFGAPAIREAPAAAAGPAEEGARSATRHQGLLNDTPAELRRAARDDRWGVVACQLALPAGAWALGGATGLAQYAVLWLLPMLTVLQPLLRLRSICEHGAVNELGSPLTAARCNLTGRALSGRGVDTVLNWAGRALLFPHHVNHHLEHHLYPAVPHYHLPRLHRLLAEAGALQGAEVRDLSGTVSRIFAARRPRPPAPRVPVHATDTLSNNPLSTGA
jgi:fatty acid desaturase